MVLRDLVVFLISKLGYHVYFQIGEQFLRIVFYLGSSELSCKSCGNLGTLQVHFESYKVSQKTISSSCKLTIVCLYLLLKQRWNLKNLSRGLNPPKSAKTRFELSAGINLETFDTILSGTNHI